MHNTITCLWIQDTLDEISELCLKSWISLGYHVNLYTYSTNFTNNISTDIHIKNATTIYDAGVELLNPSCNYSHISDEFRFNLFWKNQHEDKKNKIIWMDTDVLLLKPIPTCFNYVSSQYTNQTGAFKCKNKVMPNIGVMCLNGKEKIDFLKILRTKKKATAFQSKFLKEYEKQLSNCKELIIDPEAFCPVHWAWAKDFYTHSYFIKQSKYGIVQKQIEDILDDVEIYGVHLWRQILNKNEYNVSDNSVFNQILKKINLKK